MSGTTCRDCGTETLSPEPGIRTEYYMVHDEIWSAAGAHSQAFLCIGCLESRLGRQLHRGDFTDAGCNNLIVSDTPRFSWSWRTKRLRDRLIAADPVRDGIQLELFGDAQ